jgi:hypothetical protein
MHSTHDAGKRRRRGRKNVYTPILVMHSTHDAGKRRRRGEGYRDTE